MIPTSFHEKQVRHSSLPYTVIIVSNYKTKRFYVFGKKKVRDTVANMAGGRGISVYTQGSPLIVQVSVYPMTSVDSKQALGD